ncbi:MAG: SusC/RagA family TonB-linked outer membrane protein [Bacteroidales bacterium]|nr:SusC/RagA family TonB-linked outer membrane protein [Bacteroidales bacterium]
MVKRKFRFNVQILDWLEFRSTFGADFYNLKGKQFYSKNSPGGALDNGRAWQTARNELSLISENYFTLNKSFDAHKVNLVTGWSVQKNTSEYASAYAYDFENELLGYNSLGLGAQFQVSSNAYERFLASYLARANYSYDDRYLLTVSYRRDASSIFLENKWGSFYSGALAWNAKNEAFLESVDLISNLKFRTSWGQTGNQNIPIQGALLDGEISDYTFDGQYYTGVSASTLENKNLNWETSQQLNAGIDLGFFGNKLNIVADYYVTNTKDLLLYTPVSISTGFEFGWFNVGELKNSGYELAINYGLTTDIGFKWNTSLNITSSKNEILALGRDGEPIYIDVNFDTKVKDEVILQVGGSINDYFGYKVEGIYTAADYDVNGDLLPAVPSEGAGELPGDVKYKDISGPDGTPDGFIDAYDRTVIGNALPDFYGSFSNNFSFKGVELDVVFNFSYGNDIFNATKTRISAFTAAGNQTTEWLDSYVNNPSSTQYSRMTSSVPSELLIEDGSFLRLQTLRLGYNLPTSLTSKIKAQSVKVYLAANNLALFTKYSGYDPEVTSNQGGASFIQGFDYGAFPRAKTFLLGLNIQF